MKLLSVVAMIVACVTVTVATANVEIDRVYNFQPRSGRFYPAEAKGGRGLLQPIGREF